MKIVTCLNCNKEFAVENGKKRKFCCRDCTNKYRKGRTILVLVECTTCHKQEYVPEYRAKRYKCCSVKCLGEFHSHEYSQKVAQTCPICGEQYQCQKSKISHHRTCGKAECRSVWLSQTRKGKNNSNYKKVEDLLRGCSSHGAIHDKSKTIYQHVAKEALGLASISDLPKGYVIHHKDGNHGNNAPENLVMLPKSTHRLIHTWFGNILINALHTGRINREEFFKVCDEKARIFYKEIIDLNITHQVVLKQGELLESPEVDNQQPSIYRNIIEGSTTNSRVLTGDAEDSNTDTSALPINNGDEIV